MVSCAGATGVVGSFAVSSKVRAFEGLAFHAVNGLRQEFADGAAWSEDD